MSKYKYATGKLETKLRMDEALHQRLTQVAKEKGVSLNALLTARLLAGVDDPSPEKAERAPEPAAPPVIDDSKTIAELRAENAQLRGLVPSRRPSALPGKLSAAKIAKLITDAKAGKLKKRWFGDGNNLWLQIGNNGAWVSWIFRYDRRRFGYLGDMPLGLGSYGTVDLDMAREQACQYRRMLLVGKDPIVERENTRLDADIAQSKAKTVSQVADEYFEKMISRKEASTRQQVKSWFKTFIHDKIGQWPIQKVDQNVLLETCGLEDAWINKNTTAEQLRSRLTQMFDLAIERGYYRGKNPAAWASWKHTLPAHSDVHQVKHHDSLPYEDIGRFMQKLRAYEDPRGAGRGGRTTVSLAVEFVILTAARGEEVREAEWKEFDLQKGIWTVPWQHLKVGKKHRTDLLRPITEPMFAVLDEMEKRRIDQSPDAIVFRAQWSNNGMLNRANFNQFIRQQLGWGIHITTHGFRSTLRDWCRANQFPGEWWDIQVDHALGNKTSQSYGHDKLINHRHDMMEKWGKYCSKPAPEAGAVVNLADKRRPA
jgi:integrase